MKIRRTEELIDFLDAQLVWRKKELSLILSVITAPKTAASLQEVLIRSGIPILYAHWEGFVKMAATQYVEFVVRQGLSYAEVTPNFIMLAIKRQLMLSSETNKIEGLNKVISVFMANSEDKYDAPWMLAINTKANLSSDVLAEITSCIGISYDFFETKKNIIDKKLVDARNNIAHGRQLLVDKDDYLKLHSEVIALLETFSTEVQNAAALKSYMRRKETET